MLEKKNLTSYQKYRSYFLNYYQEHKKGRKYNFCVLCGRVNNNPRYIKVCSRTCSKSLRKITIHGAIRDYLGRKRKD